MKERSEQGNELHAKLCAYVLGEASEAERAEVEAALADSPGLRAERARLEATIGLVQKTLGDGSEAGLADQLSPAASASLLAAAEARRPRPALPSARRWYASPVLKLAAGIAAVGLTWLGWSELSREGETGSLTVARRADTEAFRKNEAKDAGQVALLDSEAPAPATDSAPAPDSQPEDRLLARAEVARESALPEAPLEQEALEALGSLGYADQSGGLPSAPATVAEVGEKRQALAGEEQVMPVSAPPVFRVPPQGQPELVQLDAVSSEPGSGAPTVGKVASGPSNSTTAEPNRNAALGAGGQLGGRFSRTEGQAAAAPRPELHAGAVVVGHDEFFLGFGEPTPRKEVTGADFDAGSAVLDAPADGLQGLGYLGEEELNLVHEGQRRRTGARLKTDDSVQLQRRLGYVLRTCQRRPDERPRDMFFRFWGDNPFQYTVIDGLSTFAADVDTASYALARRYLADGLLPEKAQIRTEEFVNYFDADVPAPLEETFAIQTELAPSRFGERGGDSWMLRVAVRGKDVTREERQPLTLTFVIDVSGSMKEGGRLELVKHALRLLMSQLDARDSIAVVAFSNEARVILPLTSAGNGALIETAIYQLQASGGTNAEAGLRIGYELARADLTRNSHNRVVLLSDGVANIGRTDQQSLTGAVEDARRAGIYLNTVGVGMGNHNDALLEQLADKGDGVCNYVDDEAEARRALVERFTGAFEPIARDVKIQVEFDPLQVQRYRLLGYENRDIADRDFRNDAVDAGEVNAGHQVVALYELSALPSAGSDGPLATVRLRWKPPHAGGIADVETDSATEVAHPVSWGAAAGGFAAASAGYRRSVLVGQFAEFLRRSVHARSDSLDELLAEARQLAGDPAMRGDPDVAEFAEMVERSRQLILAERLRRDDLARALDALRESCYLRAQLEDLNLRLGRGRLDRLEDDVRRLQERIRLLKERAEAPEFSLRPDELEAFEADNARLAARLPELLGELAGRPSGRRR